MNVKEQHVAPISRRPEVENSSKSPLAPKQHKPTSRSDNGLRQSTSNFSSSHSPPHPTRDRTGTYTKPKPKPKPEVIDLTTDSDLDGDADDHWSCPTCTLLNPHTNRSCEACTTLRPGVTSSLSQSKTSAEGWYCDFCGSGPREMSFWSCAECGTVRKWG